MQTFADFLNDSDALAGYVSDACTSMDARKEDGEITAFDAEDIATFVADAFAHDLELYLIATYELRES